MIVNNMAALMRHGLPKAGQGLKIVSDYTVMRVCHKSYVKKDGKKKEIPGKTVIPPINVHLEREYLRPQQSYEPPVDVEEKFTALCQSVLNEKYHSKDPIPHNLKYKLLKVCFESFGHSVPNSLLHTIKTPDDILLYYKTKIDVSVPLELLKKQNLPPNLHVNYEYTRFHPETDAMFGGISAFPKSSTIVTGLKYKKKYKGHEAKPIWP